MIRILIESNAPGWAIPGIKEDLAMHLERYGDCRIVEVREYYQIAQDPADQAKIQGFEGRSR